MHRCSILLINMRVKWKQRKFNYQQYFIVLVVIGILTLYVLHTSYRLPHVTIAQNQLLRLEDIEFEILENEYLVNSDKCKILNINPFNAEVAPYINRREYVSCNDGKPLLTYIEKRNNIPFLKINLNVAELYSSFGISCCYQNVYRKYDPESPDDYILKSDCKPFDNETEIESNIVKVKCKDFWHTVYENTHATIFKTEAVQKKIDKFTATTRPLSVLFVGIDSISRINSIRMLPKTRAFLKENEWIDMKGYNKMADNTFPNLMAVFTGKNESYTFKTCHPFSVGGMNNCDLIWFDFAKAGYVTAFAEDEGWMNTFNYLKKGFNDTPTDYYFRPYFLACEEMNIGLVDWISYCTGPESSGERILNLAKDFSTTFLNEPSFGVFWTNTFSHNDINSPSMMDGKVHDFLSDLKNNGVLNSSMVVFVSDHGMRFGDIRKTKTGWYEERLPMLYIWLPEWFRNIHPQMIKNLRKNENRFTTHYDLFLTLQDVLVYSKRNHNYRNSSACPTCSSLFNEAMENRGCNESGILPHWCTCNSYNDIDKNSQIAQKSSQFVINEIHQILVDNKMVSMCYKYELDNIISARISQNNVLLLMIKTKPEAVFEATVKVEKKDESSFSLQGSISRLDVYKSNSECVESEKKYCYCMN